MKIVILEPAPLDNYWFHTPIRTPHLGPPILAGILRSQGHDAVVLSELVAPITDSEIADADVVGVSVNTTLTHQRGYELAARARRLAPKAVLVAGGHHATMNPGEALQHFDFVIRGYAEKAFPELIKAISNQSDPVAIAGVSHKDKATGSMVHQAAADGVNIDSKPDLDSIVGYRQLVSNRRWNIDSYGRFLPLSFYSRGCAFSCNFCSIPLTDGKRMTYREADAVAADVRSQLSFYRFPYFAPRIWLIDDNFGQCPSTTKAFLRKLIAAKLPCKFVVQARTEIANDSEMLQLMRRSNFASVYLGVESINEDNLRLINKRSRLDKVENAVRKVQAAGMHVVALLMVGIDEDRPGGYRNTIQYLERLKVRHINPQIAMPYPGTKYYYDVAVEKRLFSSEYRLCNRMPLHFPKMMRPSHVCQDIVELTRHFLSAPRVLGRMLCGDWQSYISRRGVIASGFLRRTLDACILLKPIEAEYYTADHQLKSELVIRHQEAGILEEKVRAAGLQPWLPDAAVPIDNPEHQMLVTLGLPSP